MADRRRRACAGIVGLLVALLVSACSSTTVSPSPADGTGWPPTTAASTSPPPGLTLEFSPDGIVSLNNGGSATVWASPPQIRVWAGSQPWIEIEDVQVGARRLDPGDAITLALTPDPRPRRVGVTLWPTATADYATGAPWFIWKDVPVPLP